jgi:TonB family protein
MRNSFKIILLSTMLAPVAIQANASDMGASTPAIRISTGVVAPAIINSGDFAVSADAMADVVVDRPAVVLALRVNEKGLAENVHVVRSVNPRVDAQVLAAARGFRFHPATLDQQPVPVDLHLTVVVQR